MTKTFNIKGVDIKVEYNDLIFSSEEVEKMLKHAVKSADHFDDELTEIEVLNYEEVYNKLFVKNKRLITAELDLTEVIAMLPYVNMTLEQNLRMYNCTAKHLHDNVYEVTGPKKEIEELQILLNV